jgi:hypothetical protein
MNTGQQIEIRFLNGGDSAALGRLAERDTAELPAEPVLGGMVDGELVAAYSMENGDSIADPFHPTAEIRELLAQWARRLRGRRRLLRRRRLQRAARTHGVRQTDGMRFVPGSEHTHLLQRPRAF